VAVQLAAGQAHYLGTVLRLGAGDDVLLFNAASGEWRARIEGLGRRGGSVVPVEQLRPAQEERGPTLWFATIKRARLEMLVEKAVELGATRLQPVLTARSVVDRVNAVRLTAIATEAAEQCGRLSLPELAEPRPLAELLDAHVARGAPLYFGATEGAAEPLALALTAHGDGPVLIGPEGGLAEGERQQLRGTGALPFTLGSRTLRAETAAIAALAVWQSALGHSSPAGM
jgi:16S rRNA (uracil1498-N3)-methyltransferase